MKYMGTRGTRERLQAPLGQKVISCHFETLPPGEKKRISRQSLQVIPLGTISKVCHFETNQSFCRLPALLFKLPVMYGCWRFAPQRLLHHRPFPVPTQKSLPYGGQGIQGCEITSYLRPLFLFTFLFFFTRTSHLNEHAISMPEPAVPLLPGLIPLCSCFLFFIQPNRNRIKRGAKS